MTLKPVTVTTAPLQKNAIPVSTEPQGIKTQPRAPSTQATAPKVNTPPVTIARPPTIIAGELVPITPGKKVDKQKNEGSTTTTRTEKPLSPPLAQPPPSPIAELVDKEDPALKKLSGKAALLATSLTGVKDTLGLSVEDVIDLTKTEDNLPFIKHEPPASSSGDINDLIISAIKQTDFDIGSSRMEFSGDVQIKSPRFAMRCDRFIVHLKKDGSGISYGEGIGNVFIRMRNEGKPSGHEGFARKAIYLPEEGKLTLSGWPKIREQQKEHVAATEQTKMVLYTDGRVKTLGRNRTIINN